MTNDIFAKALAPALGFEADQVGQYVDKVLELALEELLLNGTVTIAGIGTLKRIYHPSEAREYEPGKLYLVPPRQSVELVQTDSTDDFIYEAAIGQFNMDEDRASKFSKGIALTVQKVLDVASEMEFGKIGSLRKFADDRIELTPSGWIVEMLNKSYSHLEPAPISSAKPRETSEEKPASDKPEAASAAGFPEQNPFASSEPVGKTQPEQQPFSFEEKSDKEKDLSGFFTPSPQSTESSGSKKGIGDLSDTFVPTSPPISPSESTGKSDTGYTPSSPASSEQGEKKSEEADHAWLYAEPKKDYSPIYITLGAIALVAVLIGMALLLFSGNDQQLPEKETAKIEQQEAASETEGDQEPDTKQEQKNPAQASEDNQKSGAKQEPPANKSEKPVVPPPAKVQEQKALAAKTEPSKPAAKEPAKPLATEPAKPLATDKKPQSASPWAVPAELTKKVDLKKGGYAIGAGSFPDKAVAQKVAGDYQKKGLATTIWEVEVKGTLYNRVLVGSFASQDEARAAIKKYQSLLPQGAFPVTVK